LMRSLLLLTNRPALPQTELTSRRDSPLFWCTVTLSGTKWKSQTLRTWQWFLFRKQMFFRISPYSNLRLCSPNVPQCSD
jgi:hypothetical protein